MGPRVTEIEVTLGSCRERVGVGESRVLWVGVGEGRVLWVGVGEGRVLWVGVGVKLG